MDQNKSLSNFRKQVLRLAVQRTLLNCVALM